MGLEPISYAAIQHVHKLTTAQGRLIAMGDVPGKTSPTIATLDASTGALSVCAPLPIATGINIYSFAGPALLDGDVFADNGEGTNSNAGHELFYHAPFNTTGWALYPLSSNGYPRQMLSGNGRLVVLGGFVGFGPVAANCIGVLASPNVDVPRALRVPAAELVVSPDPARDHVAIRWARSDAASVRLDVFDISGRRERTVSLRAGEASFEWDLRRPDGTRVAPGVHFAVVIAADGTRSRARFVILK